MQSNSKLSFCGGYDKAHRVLPDLVRDAHQATRFNQILEWFDATSSLATAVRQPFFHSSPVCTICQRRRHRILMAVGRVCLLNNKKLDIFHTYDLIIRMNDTKQKIMDSAEKLFGENGYAETSMRDIIAAAQVNLAAIHYHFGSKQDLLDEVILRKAGPMNERRLKLLDQFEAEAEPEAISVEKVVVALVLPAILIDKSPEFMKLMGRVHAEGLLPEVARRNFQPMIERFMSALRRALPEVPARELAWKAHFAMGAMAHTLTASPEAVQGGSPDPPIAVATRLVAFISSGFRAPVMPESDIEVIR